MRQMHPVTKNPSKYESNSELKNKAKAIPKKNSIINNNNSTMSPAAISDSNCAPFFTALTFNKAQPVRISR